MSPPEVVEVQWTPEQRRAIDQIQAWTTGKGSMFISLTGAAGTGKTTVMQAVKKLFRGPVAWTALTGKAALRLTQAAGVPAVTLHSALYERPTVKRNGEVEFVKIGKPPAKWLVVDEASMLTPKLYRDLHEWKRQGVSILFVGDGYQLPPILTPQEQREHGEDFSIFREVKGPALTQVMRSGDDIIKVATMLREENKVPQKSEGAFTYIRTTYPGSKAINDYLADRNDHVLVTWRNALRMEANGEIRKRLGFKSVLPEKGEPVLICKNGQDVLNGEVFDVSGFSAAPKMADLESMWMNTLTQQRILVNTTGKDYPVDGMLPPVKDWRAYHIARNAAKMPEPIPVTYGYVLTAHKAQGSEFRRVTVFLAESDLGNSHFQKDTILPTGEKMPFATRWLYTSITRSKSMVSLVLGG